MKKILSLILFFGLFGVAQAQQTQPFMQMEAFKPHPFPTQSQYRSASGRPAANYWQNSADYKLAVELNPETNKVSGNVVITYKNNSPDELPFVWLQLDQNLFSEDSRGAKATPVNAGRFGNSSFKGGYIIKSVKVDGKDQAYRIDDTRMQLVLSKPMAAQKGKISISISYEFPVPDYGSDRMGKLKVEKGIVYELAQWYPRMSVYDDISGWNTLPYLGQGEFYLEYGNFDFEVTVPWDYVVVTSAEYLNKSQVLTKEIINRWDKAASSDKTIALISKDEAGSPATRPTKSGKLTWKFRQKNVRDIAVGISNAFVWDAARINLPSGKKALAMSAYPVESLGGDNASGWERSTEYVKSSIENNSYWYEYPLGIAANIGGIVGGMEYPGVSFCSYRSRGAGLWGVTDHEFGHNWFPMVVGTDERRYPFLDEGFNSFINNISTEKFNNGEYKPRRNSPTALVGYMKSPRVEPIVTYPDVLQASNLGNAFYFKPAIALHLLRDVILGQERFDYAFKEYTKAWAYKHPTMFDFFRFIENAAGEDLNWFWHGWFFENWLFDQSVENVRYINNNVSEGSVITVRSNEKLVFPVFVKVTEENGNTHQLTLPVEVWSRGPEWSFTAPTTSAVQKVELDPEERLPDANRGNNVYEPGFKKLNR